MKRTRWTGLLLALALLGVKPVRAFVQTTETPPPQSTDDEDRRARGARKGFSIGGRGSYYDPAGAGGNWYGGLQVRWHLTNIIAIEGAGDYRQEKVAGTTVHSYPVTTSLLLYLFPRARISPYLVAGVGWYFTTIDTSVGGSNTENTFGPHAGAGLQWFIGKHFSIDSSYRYVWMDSGGTTVDSVKAASFNEDGYVITSGLNYHF